MRTFLTLLGILAVIGLANWAYQENYKTRLALKEVRELQRDLGIAHSRLAILEAEWAYLNRPDRLRDLAELNYGRLQLLPLMPDAFGHVDQVAFPGPVGVRLGDLGTSIEISSDAGEDYP